MDIFTKRIHNVAKDGVLEEFARQIVAHETDPYTVADELLQRM